MLLFVDAEFIETSGVELRSGGLGRRAWWTAAAVIAAAVVATTAPINGWSLAEALRLVTAVGWIGSGLLLVLLAPPSPMVRLTGSMLLANGVAASVDEATTGTSIAIVGRLVLAVALTLSVLTLMLLPAGRPVWPWLRWVVVVFAAWQVSVVLGTSGVVLDVAGGAVFFAATGVLVAAQVHRYRRQADPVQRAQIKWVVYGICVFITIELLVSLPYFAPGRFADLVRHGSPYDRFQDVTTSVALLAIPACITAAMMVGNLFDVDVIISRTLVFGSLSALVAGGYLAVVAGFGAVIGHGADRLTPLIGAAAVVAVFGPLRAWLQRRIHRLVYGLRSEPYAALSGLDHRLAASMPDDDVPAQLVSTIRQSLRAPYVAVTIDDGTDLPVVAETGSRTDLHLTLPLLHRGERVGELLVGYETRNPLSAADRTLLADLASHSGSAVNGVRLTSSLRRTAEQLQIARERLIIAREEERRRLRRDLHDGLAPTLAAAALTAATAADLVERAPDRSRDDLAKLQTILRAAVGDIRVLVDELRPPALDQLGLLGAIRERATELRPLLDVCVAGPVEPIALPAAVEVAAYRICQEALMNVVKHARASRVHVGIDARDGLQLVILDDGVGLQHSERKGVGLDSMRERAVELGGHCSVEDGPAGGTAVSVWLPAQLPGTS